MSLSNVRRNSRAVTVVCFYSRTTFTGVTVLVMAVCGCTRRESVQVPAARLPYERPLVEVYLPPFKDGPRNATGFDGVLTPNKVPSNTDVEFVLTAEGDGVAVPLFVSVEIKNEAGKRVGGNLFGRAVSRPGGGVECRTDPLYIRASGRVRVQLTVPVSPPGQSRNPQALLLSNKFEVLREYELTIEGLKR